MACEHKQATIQVTLEFLHGMLGLPASVQVINVGQDFEDVLSNIFQVKLDGQGLSSDYQVVEGSYVRQIDSDEIASIRERHGSNGNRGTA